jgi:hypothetical protein
MSSLEATGFTSGTLKRSALRATVLVTAEV